MVETQEEVEKDLFICLQDIQILREKLKMYERDKEALERLFKRKKKLIKRLAEYD